MPVHIGNNSISKAYLGTTEIQKIYIGTTEVYSAGPQMATYWQQTTTTSTSPSANYSTGSFSCATVATVLTWLNNNYPPSGYVVGTIFRVRVVTTEPAICATCYFEAMA